MAPVSGIRLDSAGLCLDQPLCEEVKHQQKCLGLDEKLNRLEALSQLCTNKLIQACVSQRTCGYRTLAPLLSLAGRTRYAIPTMVLQPAHALSWLVAIGKEVPNGGGSRNPLLES